MFCTSRAGIVDTYGGIEPILEVMDVGAHDAGSRRGYLLASMSSPGSTPRTRVVSAEGTRVTLADGTELIDAGMMSSAILGHGHPEVVAAVARAARLPALNDHTGIAIRERAAEDIIRLTFGTEPWADMLAFFVSSSEAADLGLLLSQMLTGRRPLVAREASYHGAVGLAREVSTHPGWGAQLVTGDGVVTPSARYAETRMLPTPACGIGDVAADHDCASSCLASAPAALSGAAAVILDHTQGAVCPSAQYQDTLARLAHDAGALWVADETVTAFGRTGRELGFQRGSERPDLVTLGKGLTGGATGGGALVLSRSVVEAIGERRWMTSSTYRGNPLAAAAASAVQRVVARDGLVQRSRELGERFGPQLKEVASRHPSVASVMGEGLVWIIRLVVPDGLREVEYRGADVPDDCQPVAEVCRAAARAGVFLGELGTEALWIIPPLLITEAELERVVDALDQALATADALLIATNA